MSNSPRQQSKTGAKSAAKPATNRPPTAPILAGFQRKHLRGLAHGLSPVVLVGQDGVTGSVVVAVDEALAQHELVKVRLRQPEDKKSMAAALARGTSSALCGLVGHMVILYRPDPEEPRIELPRR